MVWMPDDQWEKLQAQRAAKGGKGGGSAIGGGASWKGSGGQGWIPPIMAMFLKKGFGGFGDAKGKGKGKGKGGKGKGEKKMKQENMMWVGNLSKEVTYKELFEAAKEAGAKPKWAEVWGSKKGDTVTGVIEFGSPEEVAEAIGLLTGTVLKDEAITCDVWEKKEKKTEGEA